MNAVSAYSGPIIVVAPVGTADLRASGYEVVVDPNACPGPSSMRPVGDAVQSLSSARAADDEAHLEVPPAARYGTRLQSDG